MSTRFLDTRRPLVLVSLSFWSGVLLASLTGMHVGAVLAILLGLGAIWGLPAVQDRFPHMHILLLFAAAGTLVWTLHLPLVKHDPLQHLVLDHPTNSFFLLEGTVTQPDIWLSEDTYSQFILEVDTVRQAEHAWNVDGRMLVRWMAPDRPLTHGERVSVRGVVQPTIHRVNHDLRGVEHHYRLQHVHTAVRVRHAGAVETLDEAPGYSFRAAASRLRQDLAGRLSEVVPESALPFTLTVWLGDRHRVTNEQYSTFLESGTAHILAVSGVHIGLIYVSLTYGMRLLVRRNRLRLIVTLGVIFVFAFVAGARISSLRAAMMIGLYLSAEWFEREPDAPTALSLAALVFGLQNPNVVFMPGFQLSFLSIASILLFREPLLNRLPTWPLWLREGIASVISVQILALPAAIEAFHVVSILGIFANLVIIPLLSIVLWITALTSILLYVAPPVALWFGQALFPVVWLIQWLADRIAAIPISHLYLSPPTLLGYAGYVIAVFGLLMLAYGVKNTDRSGWTIATGVVVMMVFWSPWRHSPSITFLDVGHGDAGVIQTASGAHWLVDGGIRDDYRDMGKQVVAPFLRTQHAGTLEGVIATHADLDHVGGLTNVIERFDVKHVYVPPEFGDHENGAALLELCGRRGVPVVELERGDRISAADFELQVLHPDAERDGQLSMNNRSLMFTIETGGMRALFTGDVEAEGESQVADRLGVDVVKVPHHGSNTSSTEGFLDQIDFDVAVISVGLRGDRTVTSDEVMARYRSRSDEVLRTDSVGSVRLEMGTDGLHTTRARELAGFAFRAAE